MMGTKRTILWQKWHNPYRRFDPKMDNSPGDDGFDKDASVDVIDPEDADEEKEGKAGLVIFTPLGPVPLNEHNDPDKNFNFWLAHTNFDITKKIRDIVNKTEGVELLNIYTRYRFRVGVGKVFTAKTVTRDINRRISEYFRELDDGQKEPPSGPDSDSTGTQCQPGNERNIPA